MLGRAARVGRWPLWALTAVTGVLGLGVFAELVAIGVLLARPVPTVSTPAVPEAPSSAPTATPSEGAVPRLAEVASRPMFQATTPAAGRSPGGASGARASAWAARLTLIGVVTSDPPQAILEDAETKKTYVVTTGQTILDGLVVEEIRDNRVILTVQGERLELSL